MNDKIIRLDEIDHKLLAALQADGGLTQRALADRVGLSQNACWRRIQRLTEAGVLKGSSARIDAGALGLNLTVFVMVRTRHHNSEWSRAFTRRVESIHEIVELHRIGGDWDYLLKVVTEDMAGYDRVYQRLTADMDMERVTGFFSMEVILEGRPLLAP